MIGLSYHLGEKAKAHGLNHIPEAPLTRNPKGRFDRHDGQQHQESTGQLRDRVAFVTGGTRGIGEAIGCALAGQGPGGGQDGTTAHGQVPSPATTVLDKSTKSAYYN
jgi:hypothetical protein